MYRYKLAQKTRKGLKQQIFLRHNPRNRHPSKTLSVRRRQDEPLPSPQFSRFTPELQRSLIIQPAAPIAMPRSQLFPLEVTHALSERAIAAQFNFGEDTALVAVQHMLEQTVDLFKTAAEMGLDLKNIFALGKVYSNSLPVSKTLRDMGVTVIDSTLPEPGEFDSYFRRDIARLWEVVRNALRNRRINRLLVLDDAGVCITSVPADMWRRYAVCGVEQTTRGMVLVEEAPPPFAVISWARAAVKLKIGSPIFSQYLIEKLNTEFLQGGSLQGKQLGIIGFGNIGRGIANLALTQSNDVLFYDPDPQVHFPPTLRRRVARVDSLEELMLRCDYVLGCSGRNPFEGKWPLNHRPWIKLFSVSTGDQEFGPIIRDLKQKSHFQVDSNTWDIVSEHGPSGPIYIAYRGYPYSFVSRDTEALPTPIVQFDTGGLLAALVQARFFLDQCETGCEQNRGIHRVSPKAQRFVYERWVRAMKDRMIDITSCFDYDQDLLPATRPDNWFVENSEPRPGTNYTSAQAIEEMMDQLLRID